MRELTKKEIIQVIEGRGAAGRPPVLYHTWIYPWIYGNQQKQWELFLEEKPRDVDLFWLNMPDNFEAPADDPDYKWAAGNVKKKEGVGIDRNNVAEEWEDMEAIYERFPSADYPGLVPDVKVNPGKYTLAGWIFCFFEQMWSIRGMENALTDFYLYPEEVHRLFGRLTEFYMRLMERAKEELGVDGIFTTDDIGTQRGPFFSREIFREFFKPYYKQIIDKAHSLGMHFWLHACGNIDEFMEDFIEIGLDVIHPIQKYAMNRKQAAQKYGDRICLLAGFDVQQVIPYGTPEEVRQEVREMIDTFSRPDGRFMLTMGNGSTPDWKLESLEALYDETELYAEAVRKGPGVL